VNGRNFSARNSIIDGIDTELAWSTVSDVLIIKRNSRVTSLILRYAAAILIPVLLGVTTYWCLSDKPQKKDLPLAEIMPGNSHAILVLANGKNVNLTTSSSGDFIEKDGTVIKNANKELSYVGQASKREKKALLNTLIVPQGGEYKLALSDGTHVIVNSMSKLIFPVSFIGKKREVSLEGEAYFEVAKDQSKPFTVSIKGVLVEVLGTSFNIKAYPEDKESFTTLVEGKVKLNSGNRSSGVSFLEPDQQAVYDPATSEMTVQKVEAKQFVQWISGKYVFTNQPLDEIMKTLSRWYDFNYQYEDESLKKIRFEGGLNKYENINAILEIIKKTGKVNVTVKGKEVLFTKI
jgi:hypothetical protein